MAVSSCCHTKRETHRMRVLNNRVLIKIFGPKRKEVTWDWKKTAK